MRTGLNFESVITLSVGKGDFSGHLRRSHFRIGDGRIGAKLAHESGDCTGWTSPEGHGSLVGRLERSLAIHPQRDSVTAILVFNTDCTNRGSDRLIVEIDGAFNALFLVTSTEILSEAPFLCFSIAILWMMERFLEQEIAENPPVLLVALIAVLPLLREVGLALALSTLFVLFREKRGKAFLTIAIPAALLFLGWTVRNLAVGSHEPGEASNLQFVFGRFVTGPDDSILAELDTRFWTNLKGYAWTIGSSLFHPSPQDLIVSPSSVHSILQTLLEGAKPV